LCDNLTNHMFYLISFLLLINTLFFPQPAFANCSLKKGVGGPGGCPDVPQLDERQQQVDISWFYTWHYCSNKESYWNTDAEYVPMIRSIHNYNRSQIETIVNQRNHRGKYWLIGNEPDGHNQDNLTPTQAAEKYGEIAHLIKEIDPTAKLIMLGLTWPNITWKNNFLSAWRQKWPTPQEQIITGWHVHIYHDPATLNTWTDNTPNQELWVTEYGYLPQREAGENWTTSEQDIETRRRMTQWTNILEENPKVDRYAYFYFGHPTNWDWAYISLFPPHYSPNSVTANLANLYTSLPTNPQSSCIALPSPTRTPTTTPPPPTNTPTKTPTPPPTTNTPTEPTNTPIPTNTPPTPTNCPVLQGTLNEAELWRSEYIEGNTGTTERDDWQADFVGATDGSCDGFVDIDDFEAWREKYISNLH